MLFQAQRRKGLELPMNTITILVILLVLLSILPVLVSRAVATAARGRLFRRYAVKRSYIVES